MTEDKKIEQLIAMGVKSIVISKEKYNRLKQETKNLIKLNDVKLNFIEEENNKINKALEIAFQYGQIDGDHHKIWVIDQMVRALTGDKYNEFVKEYETDEETGEKEWVWKNGIAP